jgi:hypothetical protein
MTDGGRSAVSDLNKEKKEEVINSAQEFVNDDVCPIKTIWGGKQIAMFNVLDVMHISVNHMARLTLSSYLEIIYHYRGSIRNAAKPMYVTPSLHG